MSETMAERAPTGPGWWLIAADPLHSPDEIEHEAVRIRRGSGGLLIVGKSPARVDARPDIVWLAPIPTPDECVAFAAYKAALLAWDAAPHEGVHAYESAGLDDELRAAIRAAREVGNG